MIYVTHEQVEAMTMGDRIVVMLDGLIQQVAPPLELYHHPVNKFVAGFIGSPPMNMIDGRLSGENGTVQFIDKNNAVRLTVPPARHEALKNHVGKNVTLGIRPEHLRETGTPGGADGTSITALIEVVEPMGFEINLYLNLGGQNITARINTSVEPAVNTRHVLDVDMNCAHFFDAETERTIV
jgi:multiple sugar transport system ATP-binding protein